MKNLFGLVGRNISYSFSRGYFSHKFEQSGLDDHQYVNFDLQSLEEFPGVLEDHPELRGLNVTIPYKEAIIPYLNALDPEAQTIGAVNTIAFTAAGLKGYNTDIYGFEHSLLPHLAGHHKKALILGTGGAAKAVAYVLGKLQISYQTVSRQAQPGMLTYADLDQHMLEEHPLIINCTPLGTHPKTEERPEINYALLDERTLLFDLIYNPSETTFMRLGRERGATAVNGLRMLELQAEKAWEIWNRKE